MNTDLNTRGRITMRGIERCTPKMNSFLTKAWGTTLSPLPSIWWVGLLKRLMPLSDKAPWPVRQEEASQITFPQVANSCPPLRPLQCWPEPGVAPPNPPALCALVKCGCNATSKLPFTQTDLEKRSFDPQICLCLRITGEF